MVRLTRSFRRLTRHLLMGRREVRRLLPGVTEHELVEQIAVAERGHTGQIRVAVEARRPLFAVLRGETPRQRAEYIFSTERIWDTQHNNGALLYVCLADRDVELVVDRGICSRVSAEELAFIVDGISKKAQSGQLVIGLNNALLMLGDVLRRHFAVANGDDTSPQPANELPNTLILQK